MRGDHRDRGVALGGVGEHLLRGRRPARPPGRPKSMVRPLAGVTRAFAYLRRRHMADDLRCKARIKVTAMGAGCNR